MIQADSCRCDVKAPLSHASHGEAESPQRNMMVLAHYAELLWAVFISASFQAPG
jgi:hypothetical protein